MLKVATKETTTLHQTICTRIALENYIQELNDDLARFMDLPRHQSRSYRMNANSSSINTYIYILPSM